MTPQTAEFPAVLILSRAGYHWKPPILAFIDEIVHSQKHLDRRIDLHQRTSTLAGPGAPRYEFTLAPVDDADLALSDIRAALHQRLSSGTIAHLRADEATAHDHLRTATAKLQATPAALRAAATTEIDHALADLRAAGTALSCARLYHRD